MNELIKITTGSDGRQAVNARDLHTFLESKQEFAHWIKGRIKKYGFVEGVDFVSFDNFIKRAKGGTTQKEYALTLSCSKEISMVEGSERGKQARQYFIKCEAAARNLPAVALQYENRIASLEGKLKQIEASTGVMADNYTILGYCRSCNIYLSPETANEAGREAAKICRQRGIPIQHVPDARYGIVNSYHRDILREVFSNKLI